MEFKPERWQHFVKSRVIAMSVCLIVSLMMGVFLCLNVLLVWLADSMIFAYETAAILRLVAKCCLTLCLALNILFEYDLIPLGCVVFFGFSFGAWVNIKIMTKRCLRGARVKELAPQVT